MLKYQMLAECQKVLKNSAYLDQTASEKQSDQGFHFFYDNHFASSSPNNQHFI